MRRPFHYPPRAVRCRASACAFAIAASHIAATAAGTEALPLLPDQPLGQAFIAPGMLRAVRVVLPTWQSSNAAATLSLWSSTDRVERLVTRRLSNIADNAEVRLALRRPAPPGSYLWELSEPGAEGRVGLYADPVTAPRDGWATTIGAAVDPARQFRFRTEETPAPAVLIARLRETTNAIDMIEAARALALCAGADHLNTLAPLLGDEERSHAARIVFEASPDARANALLRDALRSATGHCRAGIVQTLGRRRDADAVPLLAPLLDDSDPSTASAAAWALGRIGTKAAAQALDEVWQRASQSDTAPRHLAIADALVEAARTLEHDDPALCRRLLQRLADTTNGTAAASAALLGLCRLEAEAAIPQLARWVAAGPDTHRRIALWAFQNDLPGSNVTAAGIAQLPTLTNDAAAVWAAAIAARGDPTTWRHFFAALTNASPDVHRTVIHGLLDWPPNGFVIEYLLDRLSDPEPAGAAAAECLERLGWSEVDRMVAERLQSSFAVGSATNLLRVAARRRSREATAAVWTAARSHPDPSLRVLCARALGDIAAPSEANDLADLLVAAGEDQPMLAALTHAWRAALKRWPDRDSAIRTLRGRWAALTPQARIAVLRIASADGGAEAVALARAALDEGSPDVRAEAVRRLSEWSSPLVLPHLVELTQNATNADERALLLQGALRLCASTNAPPDQRTACLLKLHPLLVSPAERRAWLAAATLPDRALLDLARAMMADPEIRAEAAAASLNIAEAFLDRPDPPPDAAVLDTLRCLADQTDLAEISQRARAHLERRRTPSQ